jgi:Tfp pilus assembly protein PilF
VTRIGAVLSLALLLVACGSKAPEQVAQEALDAGLQAHIAGDLALAKTRYAECLRAEPDNTLCLYNDGLVAQTEGRIAEAENRYRLALVMDPTHGPSLYNLGLLLTPTLPDEAISLLRRYLEGNPSDAAARVNLGAVLRTQGDEAGAQEQFARARELDPAIVIPEPAAS